jgi:hypothetical protein
VGLFGGSLRLNFDNLEGRMGAMDHAGGIVMIVGVNLSRKLTLRIRASVALIAIVRREGE